MDTFWGQNSSWFWSMVQAIAAISQTLVVGITLFLIYRQVKLQRHANIIITLGSFRDRWYSDAMLEARLAVCHQFKVKNQDLTEDSLFILGFFEEMGGYYRKGFFEIEFLWSKYSFWIENLWPVLLPLIKKARSLNDNTFYEDFEYLVIELTAHSKKRNIVSGLKDVNDVEKFVENELLFLAARGKPDSVAKARSAPFFPSPETIL